MMMMKKKKGEETASRGGRRRGVERGLGRVLQPLPVLRRTIPAGRCIPPNFAEHFRRRIPKHVGRPPDRIQVAVVLLLLFVVIVVVVVFYCVVFSLSFTHNHNISFHRRVCQKRTLDIYDDGFLFSFESASSASLIFRFKSLFLRLFFSH